MSPYRHAADVEKDEPPGSPKKSKAREKLTALGTLTEEERHLWDRMLIAVASVPDVEDLSIALNWADRAVVHRRERFWF